MSDYIKLKDLASRLHLKKGDNVRDQFNVEVVVEDDVIIAIRS